MDSASRVVQFSPAPANTYSLPGVQDFINPSIDYQVELAESPYRTSIESADFGGDSHVVFNGFGIPDNGVRARDHQRTVTLEPSGAVSIE
jgi:hypothetical protein